MDYYSRLSRLNAGSPFASQDLPALPQVEEQRPRRLDMMMEQTMNNQPVTNILNQMDQPRTSILEPLDAGPTRQNPSNMLGPLQIYSRQQNAPPMQQSTSKVQAPNGIQNIVNSVAAKNGVKADLINAIIKQESNFNPNAKSHAGAAGLMQLMPGTARGLGVKNSYDPAQNVDGGSKYIKQMLQKYPDVRLALAAYNWGPGNVDKAIKKYGNSFEAIQKHMPKETRNYVPKVLGNMGM